MSVQVRCSKLLLVEGQDEQRFFTALLKHASVPDVQVVGVGGREKFRPNLKAIVQLPNFHQVQALGVVRDADSSRTNTFRSVADALHDAGLAVPKKVLSPAGGTPKVTVLILPAGRHSGKLEHVCLEAVADDPAITCAEEFLRCVRKKGLAPRDPWKAKLQVFLASRPKPGLRLGEAAEAGYWPWDAKPLRPLVRFLRLLGAP
jgi:hypothetical protein